MVKKTHQPKEIVVDGSNVAYNFRGNSFPPLLDNILLSWKSLKKLGFIPIVIVDYTLCRQIDQHKELKHLVDQEKIHKVPQEFKADSVILDLAFSRNAYILSNDRFRPYWKRYGKTNIERKRIPFKMIQGKFYYVQPAS